MPYTLISSVGTGMYNDGYRETVYQFPDGGRYKTRLFLQALFKCKYRDISNVILVGTRTSSWDALVDADLDGKLWENLYSTIGESHGIDGENPLISELERHLSNRFGGAIFKIKIHTDQLDENTSEEVFRVYNSLIPLVDKSSDILFDITHGFRSMPILLYQALQYTFTQNDSLQRVEVVYGEYNKDTGASLVRNLSNYWNYAQITDAVSIFKNKLDGTRLAALLSRDYVPLSKAIKKLTAIVQTNCSLQFGNLLLQLKNLDLPNMQGPFWLQDIIEFFKDILKMQEKSLARTLYNFSKFLLDKKLNVQATIALQLSVETAFAEKFGDKDSIGNYDWWSDFKANQRNYVMQSLVQQDDERKSLIKQLSNLEHGRNSIAHGGAKNRGASGFPLPENIPNIYQSGEKGVSMLLKLLEL